MENKKLGALAFLPLIVFLGTYIGCGIVFSVMGAESPFGYFPRHVALLVGIASALILAPGVKISEKVDVLKMCIRDRVYNAYIPRGMVGK